MATRKELLDALVEQIADYREGEIAPMNAAHVDRWVKQFPANVQEPLLSELAHVFSKTYFTRKNVEEFLTAIAVNQKLTSDDPAAFWKIRTYSTSRRQVTASAICWPYWTRRCKNPVEPAWRNVARHL